MPCKRDGVWYALGMATIAHQQVTLPDFVDYQGVNVRKWPSMALGDDGGEINLARFNDKTVQVSGTFGAGGKVVIEAWIIDEWVPIRTVFGGVLEFTSSGMQTITEVPIKMRPRVTGGDGTTSINVAILTR